MADQRYYNMNAKGEDNRYKVNTNILRMMQANPALGTGYIIGSMLGENYWGKKRAKTRQGVKDAWDKQNGSVGADENGTYGTTKEPSYYENMNKALEEYKNSPNGNVLYSGRGASNSNPGVYIDTANGIYPQTPQQANKPAVTTENAGNGGGVPSVADAWNNIVNSNTYNPGNTATYTNGARNLGNVIGADANGVYGVVPTTNAAPSVANFPKKPANGPAPYTDDQLRQIAAQNFTPEELSRMTTDAERKRMAELTAPQGGGLLTTVGKKYAPASPQVQATIIPEDVAAAMDRRNMFVPEEEAGLAEARSVANNFSPAAATRAGATDYNSRFITPGHDDSLTWNAIFGNSTYNDPAAQARAAEYLKNMPG